ncbi:MAG TPA: histidine kinase [Steroidobacteraceae bacterium]|jgi:two-component system sensor histidine kinase AlgZ|nr:histidine kinase [Steroidobacteraceae bacterium]
MHPIVARRERLILYLSLWIVFGLLLATVMTVGGRESVLDSVKLALPISLLLGVLSLPYWYLVRVLPADSTPLPRLAGTWLGVGVVSLAIWISAGIGWESLLLRISQGAWVEWDFTPLVTLLLFSGTIGLLVALLGHYMLAAFERSVQAERRALELRVLAREAELRSLRGQLDPHFLFNSLNSVAALIGSDAQAARRMCYLMAGFFRKSLSLGGQQSIALAEEISLAETFLAIEEVRFGDRLRKKVDVDRDALTLAVPPLVLQPLVENAVHHGVAHLVDGGEVMVRARQRDGLLELTVENPCDPDRPPSRGTGVGLANVRSRIEALFGHRGSVDVVAASDHFRVCIVLPASPITLPASPAAMPSRAAVG